MISSSQIFFLSLYFVNYFTLAIAQVQLKYHDCYDNGGRNIRNTAYEANLNHLLNSPTNATSIIYGYYNSSYGEGTDKVYASALCRPDMGPDSCGDCINVAKRNMTSLCPDSSMAIGGYEDEDDNNCIFRYAHYSTLHRMENAPYFFVHSEMNITDDAEKFNHTRESLLDKLRSQVAASDSPNMYAVGDDLVSGILRVYALVQCTPDLTDKECDSCLIDATNLMRNCCDNRVGGRVITPSCNFRYETSKFYKTSIEEPPVSPTPPTPNGKNYTVIIIVVGSTVTFVMLLIIGIGIFLRWRKSEEKHRNKEEIRDTESFQFNFDTIRIATDDFSETNKLGQGGFGAVYKGILSDGQQVAVKRLSMNSTQGEVEFKNEVVLVAKLQHRNLVRLFGFCLERKERILVYEFMPKGSLDHFIFDPINRGNVDWKSRYKIIVGIARGLLYLHEDSRLRIIHRDLKASNILLDSEMNPKISDFGMARLFNMDQTQMNTSQVAGTFGYMAPEYVKHGRLSVKSDVYSFGVLVLEIVAGQKRSSFGGEEESEDLLTFAWKSWREGTASNLIDPALTGGSTAEMTKCIHIGLLCVQETVSDRPSMTSVVHMLNSDFLNLPAPSKPGFFMHSLVEAETSEHSSSRLIESDQHRNEVVPLSQNEASITELYPR